MKPSEWLATPAGRAAGDLYDQAQAQAGPFRIENGHWREGVRYQIRMLAADRPGAMPADAIARAGWKDAAPAVLAAVTAQIESIVKSARRNK